MRGVGLWKIPVFRRDAPPLFVFIVEDAEDISKCGVCILVARQNGWNARR